MYVDDPIMAIIEKKLSPTPISDGKVRVGGESMSGTNSDIDAAIVEAGLSPGASRIQTVEESARISKAVRAMNKRRITRRV